jgi:cytochrome c-type protein NapB
MKKRAFIIVLCIALMISAIAIIDISMAEDGKSADFKKVEKQESPVIPTEAGVFGQKNLSIYTEMPKHGNAGRTLDDYYSNRAYPGAPPTIPHPLLSPKGIGGQSCLQCHENGGYVSRFEAYAPITPHPQMLNCKQCHVPQTTTNVFQPSNWEKIEPPQTNQRAMAGSPPIIPHSLQMRKNCLSCHGGPHTIQEIRVSHPERINCRQCHAVESQAIDDIGGWIRNGQ